jgi:hypothetical protein
MLQTINFAPWESVGCAPRKGFHPLHPLQNFCFGVLELGCVGAVLSAREEFK